VQRSHGRPAVSAAEDKRSASSFVMGVLSGAKYWFSGCPNRVMYKVSPLESTAQSPIWVRWNPGWD
jgi:hypothetical protein